jgi:hypothetical protein
MKKLDPNRSPSAVVMSDDDKASFISDGIEQ